MAIVCITVVGMSCTTCTHREGK